MKDHTLQKHTLNLRRGDYERIGALFPDLDAAVVIRRVISRFVDENDKLPETDRLAVEANL